MGPGGPELHRAADATRDQSYFLFTTTREQLDYLRFPLGGFPKSDTRAAAEAMGLVVAAKPDSQDICFVPDGDYASIVRRVRPDAAEPGEIVHLDGRVLGRHAGVINYTVGQRRGLEISAPEPLFVVALDAKARRVTVGPRAALAQRQVPVRELNWIGPRALGSEPLSVAVKIRSMRPPVPAEIAADGAGGALVTLLNPQEAIAPGQACVVYDAETQSRLLGGGWIGRAARTEAA
jgi:tRNA-specific 2-thiouridylase